MKKQDYRQINLNTLCEALLPEELCAFMECAAKGVNMVISTYSSASKMIVPPEKTLLGVMIWEHTPQGHDYWLAVNKRLSAEQ